MENTPTGVGKTRASRFMNGLIKKHPHGRGEDFLLTQLTDFQLKTPPRAWGRQKLVEAKKAEIENTPTGVGKTILKLKERHKMRNTPTGVGKTAQRYQSHPLLRKHPHGRGEDMLKDLITWLAMETPPRAWGRLNDNKIV